MNEHIDNLIEQTTMLRYSTKYEDIRELLKGAGYDAFDSMLFSVDHAGGNRVSIWIALPDGSIIQMTIEKVPATKRYATILESSCINPCDDEELQAVAAIVSDPSLWDRINQECFRKKDQPQS